jgi:hypothetical protein
MRWNGDTTLPKTATRKDELSTKPKIREKLLKLYKAIDKAWQDAADRIDMTSDYWDLWFCKLNDKQFYNGNSQVFVPIIRDAVEARTTRFTNQVFPVNGRYVEVVTSDDELPDAQIALIDHYVDAARLRTDVIPALFRNGDVEGQYNIYVSWREFERHTTTKTITGPTIDGIQHQPEDVGVDPIEDVSDEVVEDFGPHVEVIADSDTLLLPAMASSADEAIQYYGGSVTILRRWTKENIEKAKRDGDITKDAADDLLTRLENASAGIDRKDAVKDHLDAAGVKKAGKYALVYETWTMVELDGTRRIVRVYFGGPDLILGCKLNPYWCDLIPVISAPIKKVAGSGKGNSMVGFVADLQYSANDFWNQGADSATYALLPIIMTDPAQNPRANSMVIDLAAVWEVNPETTKFASFPPLYKDALAFVGGIKSQIFESLSVNPSMVSQRSGGKKPSQAEIAAEQQIDIMTVADVLTPFEHGILTPMVQRFVAYDAQFRSEALAVKAFGADGQKMTMQEVPPQQLNNKTWYRWLGVEAARSAQQMQMQMAGLQVLAKIPPQMLHGKTIDMGPVLERFTESVYGAKLAAKVLKPLSDLMGMQPEEENQLLMQDVDLPVSPVDDDRKHLQVHAQLAAQHPNKQVQQMIRQHMFKHQQQMGQKNAAHAAQAQQGGGSQGGGGGQAGAVPQGPQGPQNPPGSLRPQQMPLRQAG